MKITSTNKPLMSAIATAALCIASQAALSQSSSSASLSTGATPADNTKSNKVDPSNTAATADAQKDNLSDRTITQRIRQSVIADKSLSTYAHNVKIVSVGGNVTLNGVVRSDQERASVEAKAASIVGQSRVVNDLKVSPKS